MSSQKRARSIDNNMISLRDTKRAARGEKKKVVFAQTEPTVHYFDPLNGYDIPNDESASKNEIVGGESGRTSQLTEELTLLSTLHGKSRRELRDISKHDLKTVMKYGIKTKGRTVNGDQRWKFEFGNTTYITDNSMRQEVTCYKKAITIEHATITQKMIDNHKEVERILREDPHLCTTQSIIIIDQSGSMKTCDVNGFRSRSDAAYGTLALDYIAEQLYQQGDELFVDAVTIIEMNDTGSIFVHREPLDWILFNKVLDRMSTAKPKFHGNYVESLEFAESIIQQELTSYEELEAEEMPAFTLLFISDGKPSDKLPEHQMRRLHAITRIAGKLKSNMTFLGMGIGSSGSDFEQMQLLVKTAEQHGAVGHFNHAGLNPVSLSTSLSSIATTMTATRNDLRSTRDDEKQTKTEKTYVMRKKKSETNSIIPFRRETTYVSRFLYTQQSTNRHYPWRKVPFIDNNCHGFEIEKDPFGKGAERLAFMFYEVRPGRGQSSERVGKTMVAKESRYIVNEESKEAFHTDFCRVQSKAKEFATIFNDRVKRAPLLQPSEDEVSLPPPVDFLRCSVYEYSNYYGVKCGLLVENYLKGKFTKFNSNNGYVNSESLGDESIDLAVGEVKLTDFVQAFSHWVYEHTHHSVIVCDLQGVLDLEGRRPIFRLTDPAICSKGKSSHRYGKTDLGMRGIRRFCSNHVCNDVCKGLNLPSMRRKSPRARHAATNY